MGKGKQPFFNTLFYVKQKRAASAIKIKTNEKNYFNTPAF